MSDRPCCVYAIECGGFVKIGVAEDVERRLHALQTANPTPLRLLDHRWFASRARALVIEWCIHSELEDQHSSGEWFKREPTDPLMWLDFYHEQDVKLRRAA